MRKAQQFAGGKAALDKIQAWRQVSDLTMKTPQGDMQVEMDTTTRYPDSQRRIVKTPMGEMTSVISPNASFRSGPMGSGDLPASQRDAAIKDMHMDLLTVLRSVDQPGYTFTISGTEKVGDVTGQVVTVANANYGTAKWTIDPATGRILRITRSAQMGEQTSEFGDWKTFGGINMPTSVVVSVNGEKNGSATVKSVEMNPAIEPGAFEKPKQ